MSEMICSICDQELDIKTRWPRLIPNTGDTICQSCVQLIINNQMKDQQIQHIKDYLNQVSQKYIFIIKLQLIKQGSLRLDDFPLNQSLLRILQYQSLKSQKTTPKNNETKILYKIEEGKQKVFLYEKKDASICRLLSDTEALTTSVDEPLFKKNFLDELSSSGKKKRPQQLNPIKLQKRLNFATQSRISQQEIDDSFTSQLSFKSVQQQQVNRVCDAHKRPLEVVCLDCQIMICTNCALFGNHKGHNIYSEEDLITLLEGKGAELTECLEKLHQDQTLIGKGVYDEQFYERLRECQQNMSDQVSSSFKEIRNQVDEAELMCLKQIKEQMKSKEDKWNNWWESQISNALIEEQCSDWIHQAQCVFDQFVDNSKLPKYWELLSLSDQLRIRGMTLQQYGKQYSLFIYREVKQMIAQIKNYQSELFQNQCQVKLNVAQLKLQIDEFAKFGSNNHLQLTHSFANNNSPEAVHVKKSVRYQTSCQEDSDLLQDASFQTDQNNQTMQYQFFQGTTQQNHFQTSSPLMMSQQIHFHHKPIQSFNQIKPANSKLKNSSFIQNTNQTNRNQRSITPNEIQGSLEHSLSPLNFANDPKLKGDINRQSTNRRKPLAFNTLPQKLQSMVEEMRKGKVELTVDISGFEMNSDMVQLIGFEMRNWHTKSIKFMKNKLTDDNLVLFFQSFGNHNQHVQSINLSQNLLSDRSIDLIQQILMQGLLNPALKNIILSQNKISARNCKNKVQDLKKSGLTITL